MESEIITACILQNTHKYVLYVQAQAQVQIQGHDEITAAKTCINVKILQGS